MLRCQLWKVGDVAMLATLVAVLAVFAPDHAWVERVCSQPVGGVCENDPHLIVRGIDYEFADAGRDGVYAVCLWAPRCGPYHLSVGVAVRSMVDPSWGDDERLGA